MIHEVVLPLVRHPLAQAPAVVCESCEPPWRDDRSSPFRPDHGQEILDDLGRRAQPGHHSIGRLEGPAELRGVIAALSSRISDE